MGNETPVSVECGTMVVEQREHPGPSGFTNVRVQCRGLAIGNVTDKELVCNQCKAKKPNPYYVPETEPVHVKKKVDY